MLSLLLLLSSAWAGPHADLPSVLEQIAPLRAQRLAEGVPPIPASDYEKVAEGEVATGLLPVDGYVSKKAYGIAILDAPVDKVWGAINDESLHVRHTDLGYAELIRGEACESGRQVLQFLPLGIPLVEDRWWVTIRTLNPALKAASDGRVRELVWRNAPDGSGVTSEAGKAKMAEGLMVGFTKGSWFVVGLDSGHTLVEYYTWVDPGGKLPKGLMNMFAARSVKNALEGMERIAKDPEVSCTDA